MTNNNFKLRKFNLMPFHDNMVIDLAWGTSAKQFNASVQLSRETPLDGITAVDSSCGEQYNLSAAVLFSFISNDYDLDRETAVYFSKIRPETPLRIAFTVRHSTAMGGGSMNFFRYANWLADLGAEVTIYSDDYYPPWTTLNVQFRCITDDQSRYAAITEPLVIVYSVLELPHLLRHMDTRGKLVFHLCQGAEEFHYAKPVSNDLLQPIPIFDLLNTLPVGRLVVSPHLEKYFRSKYGQETIPVYNGVNLDLFRPADKQEHPGIFTVLVSGNPNYLLKGIDVVRKALGILASRRSGVRFHLINVCGEHLLAGPAENCAETGYTYELRCGVTPAGMKDLYCQADVVVNASWYEGFGLPALEAMACGTPVIMTDNHGLDGIAENGRNCLVVPVGEPEAIVAAVERLLDDPTLCRSLAACAQATSERFSIDRQREMFIGAIERISGHSLKGKAGMSTECTSPLFSILVPCYNQARFLSVALDSIIAQTYGNWEALVVNDGSTDSTAEVMASYARQEPRIRCFHQENGGVAAALNRGLAEARGEWICWLSSDDLFIPDKLACHLEVIAHDPGLRLMHTNYLVLYDESGQVQPSPINVSELIPPTQLQVARFLEINYFNGISIAVHRNVFDIVGYFSEGYRYGQDFDLWLRASARFRSRFIDRATCVTRIHPGQGTNLSPESGIYDSARAALDFLNRHRLEELFPLLDLGQPEQACHAISALLRTLRNKDSFICRCGYEGALVDRIKEWRSRHMEDDLSRLVDEVVDKAVSLEVVAEKSRLLASIRSTTCNDFSYTRYDWLAGLERQASRLEREGRETEASSIQRYVRMVDSFSEKNGSQGVPFDGRADDKRRIGATAAPVFSIVVPTYNQADFLREALDSILAQNFADWEALVINDGSTDHTCQIMAEYAARDPRIRIFHKQNGGVASALNRGIREAGGQWVCWLSSDDVFEPNKLRIHYEAVLADPSIRFMHTNFSLFYEQSRALVRDSLRVDLVIPPRELQLLYFFRFNYINGISIAVRRDLFKEVGLFNESLRCGQDYDMWLRITARFPSTFIDRLTCVTRIHPEQETNRFVEAGIFDSCCSAVEFLNTHSFADIFPCLNLTDATQATKAVEQTLCVLAEEHAYVHMAGFAHLLADRLLEWLAGIASVELREHMIALVGKTAQLVLNSVASVTVGRLYADLVARLGNNVVFNPADFCTVLNAHRESMLVAGRFSEAAAIKKYLDRVLSARDAIGVSHGVEPGGLNILFVLHNFVPHNYAGVENYTFQIAKGLIAEGHQITVIYPCLQPGAAEQIVRERFEGVNICKVVMNTPPSLPQTLRNQKIEEAFTDLLRSNSFDLVHVHHTQLLFPLSLVLSARQQGVPTVLTLHDFWLLCLRTHLFRGVEDVCSGPEHLEKCSACLDFSSPEQQQFLADRGQYAQEVMDAATLVTAPSRFVADMFARYGCKREIAVRPLGVVQCPHQHRVTGQELVFGYIGTINEIKNVFGLVHAFQKTRGSHAKLRIYGDGAPHLVDLLRGFISDSRVEFCGGYKPDALCSILSTFDMTVVPSYIESYCLTVRESLAAGVPVIAAQVGGIPEAVTHLENGILFDPNQLQSLANWLQAVIDDRDIIAFLAKNAKPLKTIIQDAAEWSSCYRQLVVETKQCNTLVL